MCEICSQLTIKTPERRHWRHFTHCSGASIVDFRQVNAGWKHICLRECFFKKLINT